ncbi:MAG: glycosyltransferase family 2 protein [Limnobacter sp.]|nr:glycosyltransferase family 2 protein [Limnobacter sp.]
MKPISIIIPTWNQATLTENCLYALAEQSGFDFKVIWIDNGSDDLSHQRVLSCLQDGGFQFVYERHSKPLGYARAVNRGLRLFDGDYCVFLNNDVEVQAGWDVELIRTLEESPGIAGPISLGGPLGWQSLHRHPWTGPAFTSQTIQGQVEQLRAQWGQMAIDLPEHPTNPLFQNHVAFFCAAVSADVVQAIGALDEKFGWGYFEDNDYCARARRAGFDISFCPGSSVVHLGGQTLKELNDDHRQRVEHNAKYFQSKQHQACDYIGFDSLPESAPTAVSLI